MTLIVGNGTAFTSTAEANEIRNGIAERTMVYKLWSRDTRLHLWKHFMPTCKYSVSDVGTAEPRDSYFLFRNFSQLSLNRFENTQ